MLEEITSQKKEGWRNNLTSVLQEKALLPFAWGTNDCATLVSDCVLAMTGKDPLSWARRKYYNKFQALRVLKGHYGMGNFGTFSRIFNEMGFIETDTIRCGDIAFAKIENLDAEASKMFEGLTLVTGCTDSGRVMVPGKDGLVLIDNYELVKAWTL